MKRLWVIWAIVAMLGVFAPTRVIADDYQNGLAHWERREYGAAYQFLKRYRDRAGGSPKLDYTLGTAACRAGEERYGSELLTGMLVSYQKRLSAEEVDVVIAERDDCRALLVVAAPPPPPQPGYKGTLSTPSGSPRPLPPPRTLQLPADDAEGSAPHAITLTGTVPTGQDGLVIIQENTQLKAAGTLKFMFSAPAAGNYALNFCIGPRSNPCGLPTSYVVVVPGGEERLAIVDVSVLKGKVLNVGQGTNSPLPFSVKIE